MRKNKVGRPTKIENIKEKIARLRELNYSYTEIGDMLKVSRQLAQYHGSRLPVEKVIDKVLPK